MQKYKRIIIYLQNTLSEEIKMKLLCIKCGKVVAEAEKINGNTTWFAICSECMFNVEGWTKKEIEEIYNEGIIKQEINKISQEIDKKTKPIREEIKQCKKELKKNINEAIKNLRKY